MKIVCSEFFHWQEGKDSNLHLTVLETVALH